ncbi:MAG: AsmA family protein [Elusimicrobia bacterium]|nr:AsmA family protein [Elusimicrobiota bacterium]
MRLRSGLKKAVRRVGKIFLRLFVFLLLLVAVGMLATAVTLKVMFTPEHLKTVLTDQMQQVFKRPVQIDSVAVIFFRGVRVRGLKILEAPDFPGRNFISSEFSTAKVKLLPLIRKKVILSELALISPRIEIVRRRDGTWNFSDIAALSNTGGSGIPLMALTVHRATVRDGTLLYEDVARNLTHEVTGFNLRVTGFSLWGEFPFEMSLISKNNILGRRVHARFALEGWLDLAGLNWEQAALREGELRATVEDKYLEAHFSVKKFIKPQIDLELAFPAFGSQDLAAYLGVPPGMSLPPILWHVKTDLADLPRLQFSGSLKMKELQVMTMGVLDVSSVPATIQVNLQSNLFPLQDLTGVWKGLVSHRLGGRSQCRLRLVGPLMDLNLQKFFFSLSQGRGVLGEYQASGVDLVFSGSDNFREASWRISHGDVRFPNQRVSHLTAVGSYANDTLSFPEVTGVWNDSPLKVGLTVKSFSSSQKRVELNVSLGKLDLDRTVKLISRLSAASMNGAPEVPLVRLKPKEKLWWLKNFKRSLPKELPYLLGRLEVKNVTHPYFTGDHFKAVWDLRGVSPGLRKLDGIVRVDWGPGIVRDIPHLMGQEKILRGIFLPFMAVEKLNRMGVLKISNELDLPYDKIHGEYVFHSGTMLVRNFFVDSPDVSAVSSGEVDWVSEKLQLHVLTRVNKASKLGSYPETLTDVKGRPTIGFFVDGPMAQPVIKPDFRKVEEGAVEKVIQEGLKRGI